MPSLGLIVLAAGGSRRMGTAKQLLPFGGTALLRHACGTALATPFRPVVVVLGAEAERCRREIAGLPLEIALNPAWQEGIAGSLRTGIEALENSPVEGALVVLADQPYVSAVALVRLAARGPLAAASYAGIAGVPAVFPRSLFGELKALEGDTGARAVLSRHAAKLSLMALPEAEIDLDTPDDCRRCPP